MSTEVMFPLVSILKVLLNDYTVFLLVGAVFCIFIKIIK